MKARYPDPAARAASTVPSPVRAPAAQAGVGPFTPPAQALVAPAAVSQLVVGRSAVGGMAVTRAGPLAVGRSAVAVDPSVAVATAVTRAGRSAVDPSAVAVGPSAAGRLAVAAGPSAALAAAGTTVAALALAALAVAAASV